MDAVEQVLVAEREWLLAHLLDIPALERLMDPDYLQIAPGGDTVNKEQVLASFSPASATGMRPTATSATSESTETRPSLSDAGGQGENAGRSFDYQARFVSVWVRRDGEWRMVSDQSTPIA